ncbi:MAG TPA: RNA polymerase sigma factor [Polyangiales bacterium]|nr:RNA polymerase sigma factor [Polyangiales bacterium]
MTAAHTEKSELDWERACMARARAGDMAAFAELYRRFAPRLYSHVLLPKLGSAEAAEDALSDSFRALLEHIAELESDERSVWPWLCRVATNKAYDMHRNKARTRRALCNSESLLGPLLPAPDAAAALELDDSRAELQNAVARVLSVLTPRYRQALELRFFQDRPREQCAQLLAVKLGTFDVLVLRALRAFRKQWQAQLVPAATTTNRELR